MSGYDEIDQEMLDSLTFVMGEKFTHIVDLFEEEGGKYIRAMNEAFDNGDAEVIRDSAHTIKSSSANYGLKLVNRIALSMEMEMRQCIDADQSWAHVRDFMPSLEQAFAQGMSFLKSHENYVVS